MRLIALFLLLPLLFACGDDTEISINDYPNPLGATYLGAGQGTRFAVYAPNASAVSVAGAFNSFNITANPLTLGAGGVWETIVPTAAPGHNYKYYSADFGSTWLRDPYGRSFNGTDNDNTIIINDNYVWTSSFTRPAKEALVIYEMHVKDFTRSDSTATRGANYLGMIDKIPYLVALGVNAVELMPMQEWAGNSYSWGYNSACYFAPENSLSPNTGDGSAYQNFKKLVDALHTAGIAVILDVVYNHTFDDSPLWQIDSTAYHSTETVPWGRKLDLTKSPTMRYVKDNLRFWMDEFRVDGFRFDATEYIDSPALLGVVTELCAAGYADRYFIFEEFDPAHNAAIQAYNTAAGQPVISSWGTGYKNAVWAAMVSGGSSGNLGKVTYYSEEDGWDRPGSVINYFSSHDEGTLTGKGMPKAVIRTAAVHLLTSMGIPMLWMGEEVCSPQQGNNAADPTAEASNIVDWNTLRPAHTDLTGFFAALIKLRIDHPALRPAAANPAASDKFGWFMDKGWKGWNLGYTHKGTSGDNNFVVLVNYSHTTAETFAVSFPVLGNWYVMCDGVNATNNAPGLGSWNITTTTSNITVSPTNALIFMSAGQNP